MRTALAASGVAHVLLGVALSAVVWSAAPDEPVLQAVSMVFEAPADQPALAAPQPAAAEPVEPEPPQSEPAVASLPDPVEAAPVLPAPEPPSPSPPVAEAVPVVPAPEPTPEPPPPSPPVVEAPPPPPPPVTASKATAEPSCCSAPDGEADVAASKTKRDFAHRARSVSTRGASGYIPAAGHLIGGTFSPWLEHPLFGMAGGAEDIPGGGSKAW